MSKPSEDEIEIEEEKVEQQTEEKVEVNTGEEETPSYVTKEELDKYTKRQEYLNRQADKRHKELLQALQENRTQEPSHVGEQPQQPVDDLDEIAQKDWKAAVRKLADEEAKRILKEQQEQQEAQTKQKTNVEILNNSRKQVMDKYGNLDDETSVEFQLYNEAMNENPHFLQNPYGPVLTMYEMEKKMRQRGIKLPEERQELNEQVDLETQRRARVNATGNIPGGTSKSNSVMLTSDQIQFAKDNNIPLKVYAKMVQQSSESNFQEGVTVDDE